MVKILRNTYFGIFLGLLPCAIIFDALVSGDVGGRWLMSRVLLSGAVLAFLYVSLQSVRFSKNIEFRLASDYLAIGRHRYDKKDVRNVMVWRPPTKVITGQDAGELNWKMKLAKATAAASYYVTFDYGQGSVRLVTYMTEPQAHAVASEVVNWLER